MNKMKIIHELDLTLENIRAARSMNLIGRKKAFELFRKVKKQAAEQGVKLQALL